MRDRGFCGTRDAGGGPEAEAGAEAAALPARGPGKGGPSWVGEAAPPSRGTPWKGRRGVHEPRAAQH